MAWTYPESSQFSSKGTIPGISKELTTQTVFIALDENLIYFWVLRKGAEVHSRQKQIEQMRKCHSVDANHVERDWRRFWCQMRGLLIRGAQRWSADQERGYKGYKLYSPQLLLLSH